MGENTAIEWTDHTFNPWRGCAKVSEGCAHCYAETMSRRNLPGSAVWGPSGTRVVNSEEQWAEPPKWNKRAAKTGIREKVFCASLADVFEDWVGPIRDATGEILRFDERHGVVSMKRDTDPELHRERRVAALGDVRQRLFALFDVTPHLDWIIVTKRPENIRRFWVSKAWTSQAAADSINETGYDYRKNVWLLTSVENQAAADLRIPELLKCRDLSPVLGLSCEPLLGPVDLFSWMYGEMKCVDLDCDECLGAGEIAANTCLDWVIGGNESGPGSRIGQVEWEISLRDQCHAAGVPFLFKQHGDWCAFSQLPAETLAMVDLDSKPAKTINGHRYHRVGKKLAGRLLDGREWNEFPMVDRSEGETSFDKP